MHSDVEFPSNFTTLMVASCFGIESIIRIQLESPNVILDAVDSSYERSALSWASEHGFEGAVELLIKGPKFGFKTALKKVFRPSFFKGATVDKGDIMGRTPLSYASLNGHLSVVRRLVKAGARADLEDKIGGTPISYALCTGRQDVANELTKGAQIPSIDEIRNELLLSAARKGHQPIVKRLLDSGADIEAVDEGEATPLIYALLANNRRLAQFLLERGASMNPDKGEYICVFNNGDEMVDGAVISGPINTRDLEISAKPEAHLTQAHFLAFYGKPNVRVLP